MLQRTFIRAAFVLTLVASALMFAAPASAATITVNTLADQYGTGAECSLREAIQAVYTNSAFGGCQQGAAGDTIALGAGTHQLTRTGDVEDLNATGDLDLRVDMTIQGQGPQTIIQGMGDRVIDVQLAGPSFIRDLTITGGTGFPGGGVFSDARIDITLQRVIITGNDSGAANGGGLAFTGGDSDDFSRILIEDSIISDNDAVIGGGINNLDYNILDIHRSLIFDNQATNVGDGIANFSTLLVRDSTIAANGFGTVGDQGGGIFTQKDTVLENVTFAMNEGGASPGSGGHIYANGGSLVVRNVLMGSSPISGECANFGSAGYTAEGTNLVESPGACTSFAASSMLDLGTLGDNGGPTETVSIGAGSDARGAANDALCGNTDQRGVPRPDPGCDVGAYQYVTCQGAPVNVVGTDGGDTLTGDAGQESMLGLGGDDTLRGAGGNDRLCGGNGKDDLLGGSGRDRLNGEAGDDDCNGGPGRDRATNCETKRSIP
ncbi:MAG: choice-of-anchor Q domain-containing protein [Actinomycetota bacterium]